MESIKVLSRTQKIIVHSPQSISVINVGPPGPGGGGSSETPGPQGLSAYQVAVLEGFEGDEAAWLLSLIGEQGRDVQLQTSLTHVQWKYADEVIWTDLVPLSVITGLDGSSAYEIAVLNGFVGDEAAWLASFIGDANEYTDEKVESIPELIAADPTELVLSTAGGVTTATIGSGITRDGEVGSAIALLAQPKVLSSHLDTDHAGSTDATNFLDSGLTVPVQPNTVYRVEVFIRYSASSTGDLRLQFNVPSGSDGSWSCVGIRNGASTTTDTSNLQGRSWAQSLPVGGIGADNSEIVVARIQGLLITGETPGDFLFEYRQGALDAEVATIVRAYSHLVLSRLS